MKSIVGKRSASFLNTFGDDRERRLATILAADIAGYSHLMDMDEEGTYTALHLTRSKVIDPRIAEHKGHIVKHMGDGFLAEFPTVMSAIHFAMAMQEGMRAQVEGVPKDRQIKFRIGINLGDIMVDDTGDIFGDGVNIAARLEGLGIPGGICISGPVYESVFRKLDVDFDDLGYQSIKNISTPVHAYDIRWPGEAGTPDGRAIKPTAQRKPLGLIAGAAVAAAALIGIVFWQMGSAERSGSEVAPNSVAVLPFINMSSDPEQEYFSDGITEEILDHLAKLPGLKVSARTSAFSFKDKNVPIPEIAQILGVAHILEGSVRRDGNRVRITAQLIEARSDTHLWSETYDRELNDIFAVQDEIAANIAAVLEVKLLGGARKVQVTDLETYALVLQARYLIQQLTPATLEKSIALLKQAQAIDPGYAPVWAGLARAYVRQAAKGLRAPSEAFPLAREAASRALILDPAYAPAHRTLARIARIYDRNLVAAIQHYERALATEPANADSISNAARMAAALGRLDQTIALAEYAVELDPVAPIVNFNLGLFYLYAERLDEAIASLSTALTLNPDYISAQYWIGTALLLQGEPEAALAAMEKEAFEPYLLVGQVTANHALDDAAASDMALAALIDKYERDWAYNIAYVLAFRDETDRAFDWLDKAVAYNDTGLAEILPQPLFANIHDDPRWLPFLESIGKSPEQLAAIEFNVTLPE